MDRGVDVAAGPGVAHAEELERSVWIMPDALLTASNQGAQIDFALIEQKKVATLS